MHWRGLRDPSDENRSGPNPLARRTETCPRLHRPTRTPQHRARPLARVTGGGRQPSTRARALSILTLLGFDSPGSVPDIQTHSARDDNLHDLVGARIDGLHGRVRVVGRYGILHHEAIAAKQLQALAGNLL